MEWRLVAGLCPTSFAREVLAVEICAMHGWWLPAMFVCAALASAVAEYASFFLRMH
jgi:hypothetical protein